MRRTAAELQQRLCHGLIRNHSIPSDQTAQHSIGAMRLWLSPQRQDDCCSQQRGRCAGPAAASGRRLT